MPDLKYLNTFRTIVDTGSFTGAAKKLNYTQSTITFQIGQLEDELSVKLFEKVGRRMILTSAGQHFVPYVDDVLNSVDRMQYFREELSECRGELKIGVGESLLCYKLPAILNEFVKAAPKAKLFLHSMNCYDIRNELISGNLDLGVFYEDVGGFGSSLTTYSLGEYPVVLVASPQISRQYNDFITPNRTIPLSFIINEPNCIYRQIFEQYLQSRSIILDHTIELWSIPTIKNLVKSNVGISFLPEFTVKRELDEGSMCTIPSGIEHTMINAVCAHHKNKWISPLMQLFIDICASKKA